MKIATDIEYAWAAGLFEGEGSITVLQKACGRPSIQLNLESSDRDIVERFAAVVGFGNITVRKLKDNRKQMFAWRGHGWWNARFLYSAFSQFLGNRRHEQFRSAFSQQSQEPKRSRWDARAQPLSLPDIV